MNARLKKSSFTSLNMRRAATAKSGRVICKSSEVVLSPEIKDSWLMFRQVNWPNIASLFDHLLNCKLMFNPNPMLISIYDCN